MKEDATTQTSKTKIKNKDNLREIFLEPTYGIKGEPLDDDRSHKSFMGRSSFANKHFPDMKLQKKLIVRLGLPNQWMSLLFAGH